MGTKICNVEVFFSLSQLENGSVLKGMRSCVSSFMLYSTLISFVLGV